MAQPDTAPASVLTDADMAKSDNTPNNSTPLILGGGALIGSGVLAGGAGWLLKPAFQKAMLVNTKIKPFMEQVGLNKDLPINDIPKTISSRIAEVNGQNKLATQKYQLNLQNFDNTASNTTIRETADNLAANYPSWRKSGFEAYGNGLKSIEDSLSNSGVTFEPATFNNNVIQKTANTLDAQGLTNEASALRTYAENNLANPKGIPNDTPITFSNAKQAIANLSAKNPKAAIELKTNWGAHLQNDPVLSKVPEVNSALTKLNSDYVPFKQADNITAPLLKNGELDTTKITGALNNYVKGKGNPQTTQLLRKLGNKQAAGGTLATPIEGLNNQADLLDNLMQQRQSLINQNLQSKVNATNQVISLGKAKNTADELLSIARGLDAKKAGRANTIGWGAKIAGGAGVLAKMMGMMSVAPMVGQAIQYQTDPQNLLLQLMVPGAENLPGKPGSSERLQRIKDLMGT